jgi:hypothetical protein
MTKLEALLGQYVTKEKDGGILISLTDSWSLESETNLIEEFTEMGYKVKASYEDEGDNDLVLHIAMGDDWSHCMTVYPNLWDSQLLIDIVVCSIGPNVYDDDFAGIEEDED